MVLHTFKIGGTTTGKLKKAEDGEGEMPNKPENMK